MAHKLIGSLVVLGLVCAASAALVYPAEDSATTLAKYGQFSADKSGLFKVCLLQEILREEGVRLIGEDVASVLFDDARMIDRYVSGEMPPVLGDQFTTNVCPQKCRSSISLPKEKVNKEVAVAKNSELCKKSLRQELFCSFAAGDQSLSDGPLRDWFCTFARMYHGQLVPINTLLAEAGQRPPSCDAKMKEFNQLKEEFNATYAKMSADQVKEARSGDDAIMAADLAAVETALGPIVEQINLKLNQLLPAYTKCGEKTGLSWFKRAIIQRDGKPRKN